MCYINNIYQCSHYKRIHYEGTTCPCKTRCFGDRRMQGLCEQWFCTGKKVYSDNARGFGSVRRPNNGRGSRLFSMYSPSPFLGMTSDPAFPRAGPRLDVRRRTAIPFRRDTRYPVFLSRGRDSFEVIPGTQIGPGEQRIHTEQRPRRDLGFILDSDDNLTRIDDDNPFASRPGLFGRGLFGHLEADDDDPLGLDEIEPVPRPRMFVPPGAGGDDTRDDLRSPLDMDEFPPLPSLFGPGGDGEAFLEGLRSRIASEQGRDYLDGFRSRLRAGTTNEADDRYMGTVRDRIRARLGELIPAAADSASIARYLNPEAMRERRGARSGPSGTFAQRLAALQNDEADVLAGSPFAAINAPPATYTRSGGRFGSTSTFTRHYPIPTETGSASDSGTLFGVAYRRPDPPHDPGRTIFSNVPVRRTPRAPSTTGALSTTNATAGSATAGSVSSVTTDPSTASAPPAAATASASTTNPEPIPEVVRVLIDRMMADESLQNAVRRGAR